MIHYLIKCAQEIHICCLLLDFFNPQRGVGGTFLLGKCEMSRKFAVLPYFPCDIWGRTVPRLKRIDSQWCRYVGLIQWVNSPKFVIFAAKMAEKACFEGKLRLWKWHLYSVKLANFTFDVCNHHVWRLQSSRLMFEKNLFRGCNFGFFHRLGKIFTRFCSTCRMCFCKDFCR